MSVATLVQPTPPVVGLDVLLYHECGFTLVVLRGEADIHTVPVVVDTLARVISERDGDVVVDLAQTNFIDTAALRAVLRARQILAGAERQLTLRSPSTVAARLLSVFGLSYLVSPAAAARFDRIGPAEEVHRSHQ